MITIYHNPRCKKSRAGLTYLKEKGFDPHIREYFKQPLTISELEDLLKKLNKNPKDIIRTQEDIYKKQFKRMNFSDHEWVKIIVENPQLLLRPIVVKNHCAVIGDPVENIERLTNHSR